MKLAPTTSDYAMTDGFNSLYYLSLGLLRGAKTVDVTIADKDTGEVYVNTTDINVRKSRYNSSSGAIVNPYVGPVFPGPQGYSRLPGNTTVTYTAKANLDAPEPQNNKRDEFCFDLLVDTEAPVSGESGLAGSAGGKRPVLCGCDVQRQSLSDVCQPVFRL